MISPTYVRPEGDLESAKYFILGEQPGRTEVRVGKPFKGPAGQVLDECMNIVQMLRSECYIRNVVMDLDAHISTHVSYSSGQTTYDIVGNKYMEELRNDIQGFTGRVIIAVGNYALQALTGRSGITNWRGSVIPCQLNSEILVVPCLHSATVIPPKNVYLNKLLIQYDLKRAVDIAKDGWTPTKRTLLTNQPFQTNINLLDEIYEEGLDGRTIDYDIEVDMASKEITCISFSLSPLGGYNRAVSIPFVWKDGDRYSAPQEGQIWLRISRILENPTIRKRGQNIIFDSHFMLRKYGIKVHNFDDTMVAQGILMPEYPKGLDFITSIWTDHPYYKADGKDFFEGKTWGERGWQYNATDSMICQEAHPKQVEELKKQGNYETYLRQTKLIEPLAYMMERGTRVNMGGINEAYTEYGKQIDSLKAQLNRVAGQVLNANSPKQLSQYFYGKLGHKGYKKGGKVTTDETAMKRLVRQGIEEAGIVLQIRRTVKRRSTYLLPEKFDEDKRLRCSYNPVGTRYSRISSSKNIFGTGMNMQNWPPDLLQYLLPDEGYIYYELDLAQAENRIVAYQGNVIPMIEAFESGIDVHSLTGAMLSDLSPEEVKFQDDEGINCDLGDGKKTWRFWGKKSNHGLNYDLGYRKFSLVNEIPEREGKMIVEKYHSIYPGVRNTYHNFVKAQLAKNRTLTNLMGRHTLFLDKWGDAMFKEAYSCIPQGTVGDIINEYGLIYIYYNTEEFEPVELLGQRHDSIGFQIPLSIPWIEHAEMLRKIKDSLEVTLECHGRDFIIPVDLSLGKDLYKAHGREIKAKDFPQTNELLADRLEELYESI